MKKDDYFLYLSKMAKYGLYFPGFLHNLNNPLTSLSGSLQILQYKHPEIEKLAELNDLLESITGQLTELAVINGQDLHVDRKNCTMRRILDQVKFFLLADSAFKHNINSHIQDEPDYTLAIAPCDFFMVLVHLFQNAIDAVIEKESQEGKIRFTFVKKNDHVVFTLTDDGEGVAENLQEKVFEPGFTTRKNDREEYKFPRQGYGLTLTAEILKRYDGVVYLLPSPDNEGARVKFTVPLQK